MIGGVRRGIFEEGVCIIMMWSLGCFIVRGGIGGIVVIDELVYVFDF